MARNGSTTTQRSDVERWSWIQFGCAFVLVGFLAFLRIAPPWDGLGIHLLKTLLIAGACACVAGRFGDAAWRHIVTFLRFS
jgi:hypothetical protein